MTDISEAMLARTPKAVRDRLQSLERQNGQLLDALQQAQGTPPPGNNTWISDRPSTLFRSGDQPLGRCVPVRFDTKEGPLECQVTSDGYLSIRGQWSLTIAPQSSNGICALPGRIE